MKGINVHFVGIGTDETQQTFAHGHGTRISIGETEDILRLCICVQQDFANTRTQDLRFAGTGSSDHHYGSLDGIHSDPLLLVQAGIDLFELFSLLLGGRHRVKIINSSLPVVYKLIGVTEQNTGCASRTFWLCTCCSSMSKVYSLKTVQKIPISLDEAWQFFSRPDNLKDITPPNLGFQVTSRHYGPVMYPGQVIEYIVRPILGIPLYWMTEITHVSDKRYFVDEQRFGPYSLWHHQHHFTEIEGGVEMTDIVHYKIPFWILGDLAQVIMVRSQLKKIFDFRYAAVEERFGKWK